MTTKAAPAKRGAKKKPILGHVKPRVHTPFLKGESRVQEVADLAEKIGMPLLEWQQLVLKDMLNIVTIGTGFIAQAVIMAMILFK